MAQEYDAFHYTTAMKDCQGKIAKTVTLKYFSAFLLTPIAI
jgi:hypothetical protein